jgi:hypothetical protein
MTDNTYVFAETEEAINCFRYNAFQYSFVNNKTTFDLSKFEELDSGLVVGKK